MEDVLKEYLAKWLLSDPEIIATTPTSHVYKVKNKHQACVLKLYTNLGREHESIGPIFLNTCKGNGVISVIDYDDDACLLDYIDGPELVSLVDNNQDEEATKIIAQTLNKIHQVAIPDHHPFKSFEKHFDALLNHDQDAPDIIHRSAQYLKVKLTKQKNISLLHGDMHHKNVMLHKDYGWIALDPQCLVGDRAYDAANTLHNPHQRPDLTENKGRFLKQADILGQEIGVDPQRIIDYAYIHGCVSSCWTKMDEGYYGEEALKTSAILEEFISKE